MGGVEVYLYVLSTSILSAD